VALTGARGARAAKATPRPGDRLVVVREPGGLALRVQG
jgi:hypothetical protein